MNGSGTPILVTGGAGFIGSHVAEQLIRRGACVSIVDNFNAFYSEQLKASNLRDVRTAGAFRFYRVDIRDMDSMEKVFAQEKPEIVIHLAAVAGVRQSIAAPAVYGDVNVGGTVNILELCRHFGVAKLVFASSSSIYGQTSQIPFRETDVALRPMSPYAATKMAAELLAYTYSHLHRLPVICLRFFTVYGPRQRPDLAIHRFTELIEGGLPIPIFGDGQSRRDYTYIDDAVNGIVRSIDFAMQASNYEVFNIGSSRPVTVIELVSHLERVTGRTAILDHRNTQPGDMPQTWADISKANRLLGFVPETTLERGLAHFVDFYRSAHKYSKPTLPIPDGLIERNPCRVT
jgi:UDP-glucuronate 4-epimerase